MNIVRLYTCPYFMDGECSLRSNDQPLDYWNADCLVRNFCCSRNREHCHIDVDTDNWSKGPLEIIRILVKEWRRTGNGNAGEIIDVIEQIVGRLDNMATICITTKEFEEEKQRAREEVWDLAQRINLLPEVKEGAYGIDDLGEAFGTCDWSKVLLMPVDEALAKDKKYQEEKKALHVGDEVMYGTTRAYITNLDVGTSGEKPLVRALSKDGGSFTVIAEHVKKTGKHNPDIEKVMASFEEEEG